MFGIFPLLLLLAVICLKVHAEIYVCEAEDSKFLGTYHPSDRQQLDGADVYSNEQDMSFFRNRGFWYLGNLEPWPPETHYRCVEAEGCNYNEAMPPTSDEGSWKGNRKFNSERPPKISNKPCFTAENEEL
jgi:hypothetical protein